MRRRVYLFRIVFAIIIVNIFESIDAQSTCSSAVSSQNYTLERLVHSLEELTKLVAGQRGIKPTTTEKTRPNDISLDRMILEKLTDNVEVLTTVVIGQNKSAACNHRSAGARDCAEIMASEPGYPFKDGVYTIQIGGGRKPVQVYCDMTTDGGGWTVFQKRINGSENFVRKWDEYADGFGNPAHEYWLGNRNIHSMSVRKRYVLRIDLADWLGNKRHAQYNHFLVADSSSKYALTSVGSYSGDAGGDSMANQVGYSFTTIDQDNDAWSGNCATHYQGGWWHKNCHHAHLNGVLKQITSAEGAEGIQWMAWTSHTSSLSRSDMKLRPLEF